MISTLTAATSASASAGRRRQRHPQHEGRQGKDQHGRDEPRRHLVGQRLDRQARALRRRDHADNFRKRRVAADLFRAQGQGALQILAAADRLGPLYLGDRRAFA